MTQRIHQLTCTLIVSIAACRSGGDAPSTPSAEVAAMTDPKQGAAGAPPAMSAPAAAAGGERSTTPSTAGAPAPASNARASADRAGSSADSKPAQPPAKTPSAAVSCELPNTYTRAMRSTLELSWPETIALTAGTGTFVAWARVTYTKSADGTLEMESHACGSLMPVMTTTELVGGLKSAAQTPFAAFDSPNMPTTRKTIMQREDRSLTFRDNTALGTMLSDPDGEWPSPSLLAPSDHDGDGSPGVTSMPLEGPEYYGLPTSISLLDFVDRLYLASRVRMQVTVTPVCSGTAVGMIEPLGFDSTALGCHVKDRDDCNQTEVRFIQNNRPNFRLGTSGTWTEVEVPQHASCADVRAALPPP